MRLADATVLAVDDEPMMLEIFSAWLERSGCHVFTAVNGTQALKVLDAEKVDAIVSDVRMPQMDGITLVRNLHRMGLTIGCIVLVSASGDIDAREAHALGVEMLVEKPLRRMELIGALERGLLDREERWLTPMEGPLEQSVSIDLAGLLGAPHGVKFHLGRGGCCFSCGRPLIVGKAVDLSLRFAEESLTLSAQGEVRWYNRALAGVAFRYLDPACRAWVIEQMNTPGIRSFIPSE
jgi:CheY-like chemotaxis protein